MTEEKKKNENEKKVIQLKSENVKIEKKATEEIQPQPEKSKNEKESNIKTSKSRKKIIRQVAHGRAYIQATYNNTIITLTDLNGNVLSWSSAGQNGFKGPKKSTPYAASVIVKNAVDKSKIYGLKNVNVFIKGVGSGRESAIRALNTYGLNVLTIKDITPIPHNGCRQKKPRRV